MNPKNPKEEIEFNLGSAYEEGFDKGKQEAQKEFMEMIEEHIKRAKVGYCNINCLEELLSKLGDKK